MKKIKIGLLLGLVAGIIDVISMIIQDLTWDANISAFTIVTRLKQNIAAGVKNQIKYI